MKQINSNGQTWLFVPVPENSSKHEVYCFSPFGEWIDFFVGANEDYVDKQKLPEGEWSIHCHSTTVTEQQAAEIVTNEGTAEQPCYTDYNDPLCGHKSAIPSLLSRAQAGGIQPPFVVLKKQ